MAVEIVRAVLTHRLSTGGTITPTVVVFYLVDGEGPYAIEGGEPPVRAGPLVAEINKRAQEIRAFRDTFHAPRPA